MDTQSLLAKRLLYRLKEKSFVYRSIKELKGSLKGEDIYVIGAGPSLDYLPSRFFLNKHTIGVNEAYKKFKCDFTVVIHKYIYPYFGTGRVCQRLPLAQTIIDDGQRVVVSKNSCGLCFELNDLKGDYFVFNHLYNKGDKVDYSVLDSEDSLAVGASASLSAIHFAYYLGAGNIILCGLDCGVMDKALFSDGYEADRSYSRSYCEFFNRSLNLVNEQTKQFADLLREKGVSVVSLNPFINFRLEEHNFNKEA